MRSIFIAPILLLLAACSAGGPPFEAPPAPQDKAVIWLFRPSTVVGGGNTDHIGLNNRYVASLDIGEYTSVEMAPGPVSVQFRQTAPWIFLAVRALQELGDFETVLTINAEPGQNYFIEFSEAELVDAARARARIGGMTRVAPAG